MEVSAVVSAVVVLVLAFSLCGCLPGGVVAADTQPDPQVPAWIVFGDSTVDVGMNSHWPTLARSNFAPYGEDFEGGNPTGRFTNGYMVTDFLAIKLGLPLSLPYLDPEATGERILQGVNFASAASGYLLSTSKLLNVIPAFEQLQLFYKYQTKMVNLVGRERASVIMSEAIFALSAGSNDFILSYLVNPLLQHQHTPTEWSTFVLGNQTQFVKQLYEAGARKFLIFGFPPIGCTPVELTLWGRQGPGQQGCVEQLNQISLAHNPRLLAAISQWETDLPGARILYGDAYTYGNEVANHPTKYGFTESRRGCCGEGLIATSLFCNAASVGTCSDPSTYVFFDSVHPTEKVYKAVAEETWNNMVPFFGLHR